jgi:hypothetical protein
MNIDGGAIFQNIVAIIAGAIGGVVTSMFAFKTKLALMEQRQGLKEAEATRLQAETTRRVDAFLNRFASLDRRQLVMLQILADVAQKVGADGRLTDLMVKFLSATGAGAGSEAAQDLAAAFHSEG